MDKKKKDFDCVEMKNKIQAQIQEEKKKYKSEREYLDATKESLKGDPIFGRLFRKDKKSDSGEVA